MQMASPSKLDRLYRFFRHEEDGSSWGCYWNVSAGSLEKRQRLYRILYKSSTVSLQDEITIDVKRPEDLKDFFVGLLELLQRRDLDPAFQSACADVMAEDPWLSLFSFGFAAAAASKETCHAGAAAT
jgi:hypothetical protein